MTTGFIGCRVTFRDFAVCRAALCALAHAGSPLAATLRDKLARAILVGDHEIDPLTVTLNSRVEFTLDDGAPQTRILVGSTFRNGLVGLTLPLTTPRGVALLGLRQGLGCVFEEGGAGRRLTIGRLLYQPEAVRCGNAPPERRPQGPPAAVIDLARAREARLAQARRGDDGNTAISARKGTPK